MAPSQGLNRIQRIVLVGHDNEGSAKLFRTIVDAFPDCKFLVVESRGLYYKQSFIGSVFKLLKEASWVFVFVRFLELVKHKLFGMTLSELAKQRGINVIHTYDINSDSTIGCLEDFKPDLLVSLFTMQIYKRRVIELPKYGSITSHPSILPNYRGLEVFFWVLANDEKETGVSIFFLSERIDDGQVIWQRRINVDRLTTVASLYQLITKWGGVGLVESILDIDRGSLNIIPKYGVGSYFSMPDASAVRRFFKLGRKFF
jgi:folate-dependent phosphoribosylglycinamide formyltransferase PurN